MNDEEICQAITSMWSRIGVKANLSSQTPSKHFEKVLGGGSDVYMVGWATGWGPGTPVAIPTPNWTR